MKRASIKNVAALAGVSIATVSRCLNDPDRVAEATRRRVEAAIQKTGYSPNSIAQSFRRGHSNLIMVVLPSIGDPFFTDVVAGIRDVTGARGYSLIISETQFNTLTADEAGAMLVTRLADGVILLASNFPFGADVLALIRKRAQPIVIGCETITPGLEGFPGVHIDNVQAARDATNHLLAQGHRRIAFITGRSDSLLTRDREQGYRLALGEAGIDIRDAWIETGDLTIDGAAQATRRLLQCQPRPTAIFCANDEMAMGCLQQLRSQEINVPGDLSVMGFDDLRYAATLNPPLTTIAQPARTIGERVAARLLKAIESGEPVKNRAELVNHRLVIRESVAPPGAS